LCGAACGPFDGDAAAYGGLPFWVGFGEKVGEGEGGAAAVGAMDDDYVGVGEVDAAIDGADGGVVPSADLAEEDAG